MPDTHPLPAEIYAYMNNLDDEPYVAATRIGDSELFDAAQNIERVSRIGRYVLQESFDATIDHSAAIKKDHVEQHSPESTTSPAARDD